MTAAARAPGVVPAYFDAALVAKFYLHEPGRDAVRRLARASGVVVSSGVVVAEVPAAFHRKLRAGVVAPAVFKFTSVSGSPGTPIMSAATVLRIGRRPGS